jgi:hypothetical protein
VGLPGLPLWLGGKWEMGHGWISAQTDRPTIWRGDREYTHSIPAVKLEAGIFFSSYFKGLSSQDQQKTLRRRLMTFKVTLTGQSHFILIFVFRKVTLRVHINSVP